jgi:hypothetical protein
MSSSEISGPAIGHQGAFDTRQLSCIGDYLTAEGLIDAAFIGEAEYLDRHVSDYLI